VSLGHLPVYTLSAAAPLDDIDRWALAGFLRDRPCDLLRCRTLPIDVPADAEVVVEGFLDPTNAAGDHRAVLDATAITHRANPILTAIDPRQPPNEPSAMRQAMLEIARPLLLARLPDVADYHLPASAGCRQVAVVSIRKLRPAQPRQTAGALWAMEAWLDARLLVIVDDDADVRDSQDVLTRVITHADFARDLFTQPGPGLATLLGIDATRKALSPHELAPTAATQELVRSRWPEYGLGEG
jgi:4-hydroxy-3-polyprenylbenzoate decarboxylase